MSKDHSGKAGDPKEKYWRKSLLDSHSIVTIRIAEGLGTDEST